MDGFLIAIVDDDPTMLFVLSRLVRPAKVIAAERAHIVLDLVRSGQQFDVILSDVMMPEMTGADLYREIMKTDPTQAARMIFLTGGATTEETRNFMTGVPCPVVMKPFDRTGLRALVENIGKQKKTGKDVGRFARSST